MPIIEIDKNVFQEIESVIERRDKMYEDQIATTKKLTDSIEKVYEQEVKKLRNQLQQKENIIKEVREYLDIDESIRKNCKRYDVNGIAILEILDKEVN